MSQEGMERESKGERGRRVDRRGGSGGERPQMRRAED